MKLLVITATCIGLVGCGETYDWHGWVYPDKNQLVVDIPIGSYSSLEACRKSAKNVLRYVEYENQVGDYECGFRCDFADGPTELNVCEKTER